jgi:hypothetical protein
VGGVGIVLPSSVRPSHPERRARLPRARAGSQAGFSRLRGHSLDVVTVEQVLLEEFAPDIVLLTYRATSDGHVTLHSSIWHRDGGMRGSSRSPATWPNASMAS